MASFFAPAPEVGARLGVFSSKDWERAQFWLDSSGFALYLLDRLRVLGLQHLLPEALLAEMGENLEDNRKRSNALLEEAANIGHVLGEKRITFAIMKGFTLCPDSVPDSTLRFQLDLDFLVAEGDAIAAQQCLQRFGYILHAISGKTWQFRTGLLDEPKIRDIYRVTSLRSVDLHLLPSSFGQKETEKGNRLSRAQTRCIHGAVFPVLAPADMFVHQALHLFNHMCSEHTRASWLLEFWRHVTMHRDDVSFWREVEQIARDEQVGEVAVGAVTLLATKTFGQAAPDELARWSLGRLPPAIRQWVEMYGHRILLADFPGNKLYLLLLRQLHANSRAHRSALRRLIIPVHWPPRISNMEANERLLARLRRYRAQVRFVMLRLRFHTVEGFRYAFESLRWQRRLTGVTE